ncbi:MAG: ThuA domain-containing protein [Rhodobacteraceae bacterium]|jgi:type 1 glutamine amidotransferase|uniref:ThuA domain-containing protein n=1 Tax=Marivita sp. TaxID=2003365 RepID=UPI003B52062A|nr:ThuA domain-containing protein [Paracoccaceae bacterium]
MSKKALIFWGGWDGHEPEACSTVVEEMLRAEGLDTRRIEGTAVLGEEGLEQYDLIVPVMTQAQVGKDELANLVSAIESGTGLGGFHGGMGDTFRMEPAYQFMVGGQWVAHPGNIIDYRIEITKPDDPLVEGIGDFVYRSEQYYMHVDPGIEVLAATTFNGDHAPWAKGTVMPVVWKHRYGQARVFYSAIGHVAAEFEVPQMREILRRGLLWAVR